MTDWTRGRVAEIADHAMKLGMTPEDAERAFTIGARFIALGYTDDMVNDMESDYRRLMRISWERWGR
ncbi:hypothetical protein SEA_CASSITA_62 [Microbacterium phage Cassita]|nr:hypothetical protein SEA_CASSITA_62 [Microbacterium phage Cassita]